MNMAERVWELLDFAQGRTTFVKGSIAGASGATTLLSADLGRAAAQEMTDIDILQFALGLEHLEAAMYRAMLAMNWTGSKEIQYITSFAQHEADHVDALSKTLQSIGEEPATAMDAYQFPAFDSRSAMLNFAKTAEELGVGAYQGAAAAFGNKDYLAFASSIVQVEARHAAIVNLLLGLDPVPAAMTPSLTVDEVLQKASPITGW
jgi:rubrerythrin